MIQVDLTNCDKEPIHIPGKIQSHGFLLAVNEQLTITFCSENAKQFTGLDISSILGHEISSLKSIIDPENYELITHLVKLFVSTKNPDVINPYTIKINGNVFFLIICPIETYCLLDFEPAPTDNKSDIQKLLGRTLSQMLSEKSLNKIVDNTAKQIKAVIGYDRVMVYKFHDDGHGEVVAEAKESELESLLGLHYPASDIPKQARELYKINLTRIIADVDTEPSPVLTDADNPSPVLDLTHSSLRAVSPIHIQYLKNMGVASSFSVSLLNKGELWGLVACHNYTPKFIDYKSRESAKLIGQVLSSALEFRQEEEDLDKRQRYKTNLDQLLRHMRKTGDIGESLSTHQVTFKDIVDATGAALIFDNQLYTTGETPSNEEISQLIKWLQGQKGQVFSTNKLPELYPPAELFKNKASGLLACPLSSELGEYLLWFRPEQANILKWAGNPDKPVEKNQNGMLSISPRKSFETWIQDVRLTSYPWHDEEIRSVLSFKEEMLFTISQKANEVRLLNERLKLAYEELDTFSYTISHDLKNPLTTIKSYSQILHMNKSLDEKAKHMVDRIHYGAEKMNTMIREVLDYSRMGKTDLAIQPINMEEVISNLVTDILVNYPEGSVKFTLGKTPVLYGDRTMIEQVFSNVIGNAVKYSLKSAPAQIMIEGEETDVEILYRIRDNGPGIPKENQEHVFELFKRLSNTSEEEGSGVGLSIVKRIIEKHHGRIWIESEIDNGATFFLSFKPYGHFK